MPCSRRVGRVGSEEEGGARSSRRAVGQAAVAVAEGVRGVEAEEGVNEGVEGEGWKRAKQAVRGERYGVGKGGL